MAEPIPVDSPKIHVRDPDGNITAIDAALLSTAMGKGYTIPGVKEVTAWNVRQDALNNPMDRVGALASGAVSGATMGVSDVIGKELGMGPELDRLRTALPQHHLAGSVAGGLATGIKFGKLLNAPARGMRGVLGSEGVAATMATEAVEGAGYSALYDISQQMAYGKAPFNEEQLFQAIMGGGALSGMLSAGFKVPGALATKFKVGNPRGMQLGKELMDPELTPQDRALKIGEMKEILGADEAAWRPIRNVWMKATKKTGTREVQGWLKPLEDAGIAEVHAAMDAPSRAHSVRMAMSDPASKFHVAPLKTIDDIWSSITQIKKGYRTADDSTYMGNLKSAGLDDAGIDAQANARSFHMRHDLMDIAAPDTMAAEFHQMGTKGQRLMKLFRGIVGEPDGAVPTMGVRALRDSLEEFDDIAGQVNGQLHSGRKAAEKAGGNPHQFQARIDWLKRVREPVDDFLHDPNFFSPSHIARRIEGKKVTGQLGEKVLNFKALTTSRVGTKTVDNGFFPKNVERSASGKFEIEDGHISVVNDLLVDADLAEAYIKQHGINATLPDRSNIVRVMGEIHGLRSTGNLAKSMSALDQVEKKSLAMDAVLMGGLSGAVFGGAPMAIPVGLAAIMAYRVSRMPGSSFKLAAAIAEGIGKRIDVSKSGLSKLGGQSVGLPNSARTPKFRGESPFSVGHTAAVLGMGSKQKDPRKRAAKLVNELSASVGREEAIDSAVHAKLGGHEDHYQMHLEAAAKVKQARDYILSLALPDMTKRDAIRMLDATYGLKNSHKLYALAASGELTPAMGRAIENVMPQEYARMQMEILNMVVDMRGKGKTLKRKTKLNLATVFKLPIDARLSPGYVGRTVAALAPGDEIQGQKSQVGDGGAPDIAHMYEDTSEVLGKKKRDE